MGKNISLIGDSSNNFDGINFYFVAPEHKLSVDPTDSDLIRNAVVTVQLAGTLLKERYGNTGTSAPYLATSWNSSSDQLIWTFQLRPDVYDSNGNHITAEQFKLSLLRRFRILAYNNSLPAFDKLIGWQDFITQKDAKDIKGLKSTVENELVFEFNGNPLGILEYLSMPTFGYYSEGNYKGTEWKDNKIIISSGDYYLDRLNNNEAVLKKRENWFNYVKNSPQQAIYKYLSLDEALKSTTTSILALRNLDTNFVVPQGFVLIKGAPIFLTSLVFSPESTIFKILKNRNIFRSLMNKKIKLKQFSSRTANLTETFYGNVSVPHKYSDENEEFILKNNKEIVVFVEPTKLDYELDYILNALEEVIREFGGSLTIVHPNHNDPNWIGKRNKNVGFDIRLATVDIGGHYENWVTRMMFCSKLGISFPDPYNNMDKFTTKFQKVVSENNISGLLNEFESIIFSDAFLMPLYRSGYAWLVSDDLSLDNFDSTTAVPRLENIRLRNE